MMKRARHLIDFFYGERKAKREKTKKKLKVESSSSFTSSFTHCSLLYKVQLCETKNEGEEESDDKRCQKRRR